MTRALIEIVGSAVLAVLLVLLWLTASHTGYADFDFGTGLVRCGVAHFPPSCATQESRDER